MKTIICPIDFSKVSEKALAYAASLGNDFGSEITLLHVYERPALYSDLPMEAIRRQEEELKAEAGQKLTDLAAKVKKKNPNIYVETMLIEGLRAEEIAAFAKRKNADLIVMGKTGESRIKRLLLGSTTAAVIREAESPILCIPAECEFDQIKKIVFATDLHEDNIGSALTITPFARHFDAEIIFVYVDDEHLIHSDEKINEMTRKIKQRIKYPKLSGYISKHTSIAKGIEYFLEKNKTDLLVMFTHKRHFPGLIFNQSITKMLSYRVKVPLLALKVSESPIMDKF